MALCLLYTSMLSCQLPSANQEEYSEAEKKKFTLGLQYIPPQRTEITLVIIKYMEVHRKNTYLYQHSPHSFIANAP